MDAAAFTPIEQNQLADLDAATIQQEQQQAAAQHSAAAADGSNCTSSGGDVGGAGANGGATSQPMGRAASSLRQSSAVSALVSAANAAGLARTTASGTEAPARVHVHYATYTLCLSDGNALLLTLCVGRLHPLCSCRPCQRAGCADPPAALTQQAPEAAGVRLPASTLPPQAQGQHPGKRKKGRQVAGGC